MKRFLFILILALTLVSAAMAADSDWKLVFQDDFERAQLGDKWLPLDSNSVSGNMSIVNGKMILRGVTNAQPNYHFKPDIKLEYDAQVPDDIPPCDVSVTLCNGPDLGWGYIIAFGGAWNHESHLMGPCKWFFDKNPKLLIEHGKKYHCVVIKEGKRITYTVNGVKLIDWVVDDPVGGPGMDLAGIMTWTGMDVDNVKAYDRITPTPDTPQTLENAPVGPFYRVGRELLTTDGYDDFSSPNFTAAMEAFNSGNLTDALKKFQALGNTLAGLLGQAYVYGDLGYVEKYKHPEFDKLADDFAAASKANPKNKTLAEYALMARWFSKFAMARSGEATVAAIRFRALGPSYNPFYYKARMYQARYLYWNGAECGDGKMKQEASDWMAELKKTWPDNPILKEYTGEVVPWGEKYNADTSKHPAWAAYLREAYARDIEYMRYFIAERQVENAGENFGGFGGGYGDDCEMMRSWMQIAAISSAAEYDRQGIQNLAQGIWDNELKDGFCTMFSDVEHSSEPSADMLPGMLFVRYGDPLWVERNLRTCKTIKDTYMGINKLGYPQFKSSVFGNGKIEPTVMGGGDSGYCARAMKHYIWEAWRGNPEARDWFARWTDGWRYLTMAEVDGKISGVVPYNVWWPNGSITPPVKGAKWNDSKLNYCPVPGMIDDAFLAAYSLTEDPKFLKPIQAGMTMGMLGPIVRPAHPEGSKDAQLDYMIGHNGNMSTIQCNTAVYYWLTGDPTYNDFVMTYGDPTQQYRVNWDLDKYMQSFKSAAESMRGNLDIQTTEVLSTDRCGLPAALSVFGAYTGAMSGMRDAGTPSFSVTYDTPSTDFAALVTFCSKERLNVWLYNFDDKPMPVGLKLWRLKPGTYALNQGEQTGGESPKIKRYKWEEPKTVKITHKAEGPTVMVPPGKVWCVDLCLDKPISVPENAPDMAIGKTDIVSTKDGLKVTVHNIGNADAKPFTVALQQQVNGAWKTVSEQTISSLSMPKNFVPTTKTVAFKTNIKSGYRIAIDSSDKQYELCESNNALTIN